MARCHIVPKITEIDIKKVCIYVLKQKFSNLKKLLFFNEILIVKLVNIFYVLDLIILTSRQFIVLKYLIKLFSTDCGYGFTSTMYLNNKCCKKTSQKSKKIKT